MKAYWCKYTLDFRFTAITSRERMNRKTTYFIKLCNTVDESISGIGEAGLFRGLSSDDRPDYENKLSEVCRNIDAYLHDPSEMIDWPSIRFAVETASSDLANGGHRIIFPSKWTEGKSVIPINGLIWMGDRELMRKRIAEKLHDGFSCVKIKIGGIDFEQELELLEFIRNEAPDIELRLDANGAFLPDEALGKLERLAKFRIHSIEQPIRAGQWAAMCHICQYSPIPVALDEELIGINRFDEKKMLLDAIRPAYIILKPTLTGGVNASAEWIRLAEEIDCGWWVTSALESNIGLNAIAQWVATLDTKLPQGLGTGQLYNNNISSPLSIHGEYLSYAQNRQWKLPTFEWH